MCACKPFLHRLWCVLCSCVLSLLKKAELGLSYSPSVPDISCKNLSDLWELLSSRPFIMHNDLMTGFLTKGNHYWDKSMSCHCWLTMKKYAVMHGLFALKLWVIDLEQVCRLSCKKTKKIKYWSKSPLNSYATGNFRARSAPIMFFRKVYIKQGYHLWSMSILD